MSSRRQADSAAAISKGFVPLVVLNHGREADATSAIAPLHGLSPAHLRELALQQLAELPAHVA